MGIVGRTGAGKSSLISALFRFAFIEGIMSIDDIDTALVGKQVSAFILNSPSYPRIEQHVAILKFNLALIRFRYLGYTYN